MQFSSITIDVVQPNRTIETLVAQIFSEVGATVRLRGSGDDAPGQEAADGGDAQVADLLLYDMDATTEGATDLLARYQESGAPVLVSGLRHLRDDFEAMALPEWLERPFSASSMLVQVAQMLDITYEPSNSSLSDSRTMDTREEPIRNISTNGPITREIEVDEASLLEEEFGLEPGVLGGGASARPDVHQAETAAVHMLDLDAAEELLEADFELGAEDSVELNIGTGRLLGELIKREIKLESLREDEETNNLSAVGPPPPIISKRPAQETMPDMPAAPRPGRRLSSEVLARRGDLPLADEAASGKATIPDSASYMLPDIDEETSLELRSFARMLAEAWGRIGQSARVEDRFDRLSRVLHALFERGLDGAGEELRRIPHSEGFNGSLRAISIVGLLRTIRDRKLRGRLEVSTQEQGYVLYLDGGTLSDIDALMGDSEQMLLQILREHGALSEVVYQDLMAAHADPNQLAAPVEMRLRMEGLVSDAALSQARQLRAREIFKRVCRARSGSFAFIEIFRGDAHAWPVHDLRVSVDELLLDLLREEGSMETGVSEATSLTRLAPDANMLAQIRRQALTPQEREMLRFFEQGATPDAARLQLGHLGGELDAIIRRLKKAELLQRVDDTSALVPSGEFDAYHRPVEGDEASSQGRPPVRDQGIAPNEATVITEIPADMLTISTQSATDIEIPKEELYPKIDEDENEIPTRSVKSHEIEVSFDGFDDDAEFDRIIEELSMDPSTQQEEN
jgi:hypothetical protein